MRGRRTLDRVICHKCPPPDEATQARRADSSDKQRQKTSKVRDGCNEDHSVEQGIGRAMETGRTALQQVRPTSSTRGSVEIMKATRQGSTRQRRQSRAGNNAPGLLRSSMRAAIADRGRRAEKRKSKQERGAVGQLYSVVQRGQTQIETFTAALASLLHVL